MSECEARTKDWNVFSIALSLVISSFDKLLVPPLGRVLQAPQDASTASLLVKGDFLMTILVYANETD